MTIYLVAPYDDLPFLVAIYRYKLYQHFTRIEIDKEKSRLKTRFDKTINSWQEFQYLFQTSEDLESVKDKTADIEAVREVIGGGGKENISCQTIY
ncbi:MAG TPA: hypothetical protein VLF59_04645 [Candidatus Saccharimonadales bacterium]|nr:hypothetical protein [Candidatus Saccharimonadales bacterium]